MSNQTQLFADESVGRPVMAPARTVITAKRAAILKHVMLHGTITLEQATVLVGGNVYCNQRRHTGALLSAMVRAGLLRRVKPGVFAPKH